MFDSFQSTRHSGAVINAPDLLRSAALRVTAARVAVLGALDDAPHSDADEVARVARDRIGALSTQAVYDTLHALVDAGLARRFTPAGSAARYELRVGDNHHHLVCRGCGAVVDVDCAVGRSPCLTPADSADAGGFVVERADVTWWGLCAACTALVPPLQSVSTDAPSPGGLL